MFMLRAARLTLRDLQETDLPLIYALSREPAVTRYQTCLRFTAHDEARVWLQEAMRHNERRLRRAYNLAVVEGE